MLVKIEHYIEKSYLDDSGITKTQKAQKIKTRNPLEIEYEDGLVSFYYFDIGYTQRDGKIYKKYTNFSPVYCFGQRKTIDEVLNDDTVDSNFRDVVSILSKQKNADSIIFCDAGNWIIDNLSNVVTIEEAEEEKIYVKREPFFKGLARILSAVVGDKFTCAVETDLQTCTYGGFCIFEETDNYRTYSIYLGDEKLISHRMKKGIYRKIDGELDEEKDNQDEYATFSELKQTIWPLLRVYPFLNWFLTRIKEECIEHGCRFNEITLLEIAREYANEQLSLEKRCETLDKIIIHMIVASKEK